MASYMNEYCLNRVDILICNLKEMILQDLTDAIEDLEMANRFFGIVLQLDELATFLNSQQKDLLMEARQLKHLLIQNGYGNLVLDESHRINRECSELNEKLYRAKQNAIFSSVNLTILMEEVGKKRKREIGDDFAQGVVTVLKNNRLIRYIEYLKKNLYAKLELMEKEVEKAEENRIALNATIESARAAASLCYDSE